MNNNKQNLLDELNIAKKYSGEIYTKVKKYQKIYGFEIGQGENDTWNNGADAFKHTFMQADIALKATAGISKALGDRHEEDGRKKMGQSAGEENMDKWNNAEGRRIAQKIAKQINNPALVKIYAYSGKLDDLIAEEVMKKMKKGELITNPFNDKRLYEKKSKGSSTGFAAPISDIPEGKIFTAEEIGDMSTDDFIKNEKAIDKQLNSLGIPKEHEAIKAVQDGSMIWVDPYKRDDGTQVRGYYRGK